MNLSNSLALLKGHVPGFAGDSSALQKLTTRPGDNDTLHSGQE